MLSIRKRVKFLGMTVIAGTLAISLGSMNRSMEKVKELTPRGTHYPIEKTIEAINKWYTGVGSRACPGVLTPFIREGLFYNP